MKSITCNVMPPPNLKRLRRNCDVFTKTSILDFNFLLNLPSYNHEKLSVNKLSSLTPAYKSSAVFVFRF